jgi:hypothetical protein
MFHPTYYVFVEENGKKIWRGDTRRAVIPATCNDPFVCREDEFDFEPLPLRDGYNVVVDLEAKRTFYQATDPMMELLITIRERRNVLLDECDLVYCNAERWDVMTDQQREAWRAYKQALRDFPETCDPYNPNWPEKPL